MRPPARLQSVIELLDAAISGWVDASPLPADLLLKRYLAERRYIGSGDRRAISEQLFSILRHYGALHWHLLQAGIHGSDAPGRMLATAGLLLLDTLPAEQLENWFDGSRYAPAPLNDSERAAANALAHTTLHPAGMPAWARLEYPHWLEPSLMEYFGENLSAELSAFNAPAPVDLRVNTLKTTRDALLKELQRENIAATPTPYSPLGVRLTGQRINLSALPAFKNGWCEVQDESAQLASLAVEAQPGETILDYCAGAGGKSLALAAMMQNRGRIFACDTDEGRLKQLAPRMRRAGAQIITPCRIGQDDAMLTELAGNADRVLVDAPCSGTGTWRRQPDARWRLTEKQLQEHLVRQRNILESAMRFLRPGGMLYYVTCSILPEENEQQVAWLKMQYPKLRLVSPAKIWNNITLYRDTKYSGDGIKLTPYTTGSDGFYSTALTLAE